MEGGGDKHANLQKSRIAHLHPNLGCTDIGIEDRIDLADLALQQFSWVGIQADIRILPYGNLRQVALVNVTDPTFGASYTYNQSFNNPNDLQALGLGVSIPLRIFDRNQGEKQRTLLDIHLQQKLADAAQAQVFGDVDSAYVTLNSQLKLLRPYSTNYLKQAQRVRDTISFSYQHGGASLLDFLDAQNEYRGVQLGYLNLVGAYLTAASQLNLAVGREVIK